MLRREEVGVTPRVLLALSLLLLPAPDAAAEQRLRLERTDPEHKAALMRPVIVPQTHPPRTDFVRSRAVYKLPDGLGGLAKLDQRLSDLCRRGAFMQRMDGYFWARAKDRRYGVAFPTGDSLIDPQNRRDPAKVYFFEEQDSRCAVYIGDRQKLMPNYLPS